MQQHGSTSPSPGTTEIHEPAITFKRLAIDTISLPDGVDIMPSAANTAIDSFIPVIVTPQEDGFRIIDGTKRFIALKNADKSEIDCGITDTVLDSLHTMLLRIMLNRKRTFTTAEKLHFITALAPYHDHVFHREYSAMVAADRNERQLLERLSQCNVDVRAAVCSGVLDLPVAASIDLLDAADRTSTIDLYSRFPFSRQTQKELSDWLPELAFREKCTVVDIISSKSMQEIIRHERFNAPQKIEKIRQLLYERRFPTIVKAKKRWVTQAAAINPDPGAVVMKPSDAFEKNRLEIKITVTSAEQARTIFCKLGTISETDWDRLIYPAQMYGEF